MEETALTIQPAVLVIGGSAGSLGVIINILRNLHSINYSIIIVLHRKSSPDSVLSNLLSSHSKLEVKEAEEKEPIIPGQVYVAPPGYHLLVEKDYTFSLDVSEKVNFSRPSIDVTFESFAEVYGNKVVALLLSGGNNDGAEGLKKIYSHGGYCIIQDPASADVPFMPEFALTQVRPHQVLGKQDIPAFLSLM